MAKQEPNKALKCYLDTFGKPEGQKVLKDLINAFDFGTSETRTVIDFIKERMMAACGSNRKAYANIMYEVDQLIIEYNLEEP
ncbi:hypothetical protein LCGC14_1609840 [marine sediment metagenome]|uniref:Uncharacterized protein n=1 Tax=marine sediment metagenome TaxID=412755 RepID=A0A0F9I8X1_9ZZZZ